MSKDINLPEDTIIDLSQPGIVHYIYPTGRMVPKDMMNPHVGGFHGAKDDE